MVHAFVNAAAHKASDAEATGTVVDLSDFAHRRDPIRSAESIPGFAARPETVVNSARSLTCCNDVPADRETSFTINPVTQFGITNLYKYTAFMTRNGGSYLVRTADPSPTGQVQIPTANGSAGDPMLAATYCDASYNPNLVAPNRVYLVHTDFNAGNYAPNQLSGWYTDRGNGFASATASPVLWIEQPESPQWIMDKPSIAVSFNANSPGWVYVVATRTVNFSSAQYPSNLMVFRSTNGGGYVWTAVITSNYASPTQSFRLASNSATCFSVVVDHTTGNVYVIWLDWSTNRIYAARSDRNAQVFTDLGSISAGTFLSNQGEPTAHNYDNLPDAANPPVATVEARSMLNVRYNWKANRIGIVWHAREAAGDHADVFFASIDTTTGGWGPVRKIGHAAAGTDQWHPALDYDGNGYWLVTYFDRRMDAVAKRKYELFATKVYADGSEFDPYDVEVTANDPSDPVKTDQVGTNVYNVGEYQDVWWWGGVWTAAYPFGPNDKNFSDIYNSGIR